VEETERQSFEWNKVVAEAGPCLGTRRREGIKDHEFLSLLHSSTTTANKLISMDVHCALYYHAGRFILVILHHPQGLAQFQ